MVVYANLSKLPDSDPSVCQLVNNPDFEWTHVLTLI